jgi:hypothetical protein
MQGLAVSRAPSESIFLFFKMLCLGSSCGIAVKFPGDDNGFPFPSNGFNDFLNIFLRVCFGLTGCCYLCISVQREGRHMH